MKTKRERKTWTVIRLSTVREGVRYLPRPKIVQDVLLIGTKEECFSYLDEIFLKPENQSSDQIEVSLRACEYKGQRSHNSQEIRKDNGKRNFGRQS